MPTPRHRLRIRQGWRGPKPQAQTTITTEEHLSELCAEIFNQGLNDLAIQEGKMPVLARKILRMRRDNESISKINRIAEPLFRSIVGSAFGRESNVCDLGQGNGAMIEIDIKPTPQLKTLLRKMRKTSSA
jgi:hypothetical protein